MRPSPPLLFLVWLMALAAVARADEPAAVSPEIKAESPPPAEPSALFEAPAVDGTPPPAPTGQITKMPVLRRFIDATYPPDAEKLRLEGAVLLDIEIGTDGRIGHAAVLEPAGNGFDEAALEAVKQFEFEPAEIDHVPAPVRVTYRYAFVLRPPEPPPQAEVAKAPGIVVLEGLALERGTRVPLAAAVIAAERDGVRLEAACDAEGGFQFKDLAPGEWQLTVQAAHFERYRTTELVVAGEVVTAKYYVRRRTGEFEAVVRARREKKDVARRTITLEEIKKIPGTQGDAIRVVQNLPGVARTPLGLGPLIVRGGRPGDTRTYIDGQLVPLLFHFGGLTSVVNSDFLDTLDFYPGNYPNRYGRSIAGVVDVNTRAGNSERTRGYANISLTESTAFLEGPLTSKGSFMVSVRRSYIDTVLPIILAIADAGDSFNFQVARYWDYQLKTDFKLGKNELSFFAFGSDDKLKVILSDTNSVAGEGRDEFYTNIGFHRLTARWARRLTEKLDHRLSATVGTDLSTISVGRDISFNLTLNTLAIREDLTLRLSDALTLSGGLDLFNVQFIYELQAPTPPPPGQFPNPLVNDSIQRISDSGFATQPAVYLDASWTPFAGFKLIPGIRLDYDGYIGRTWFDPRVTAFYDVTEKLLLKASAGAYHQPPTPDKLTRRFGNPDLIEEGSRQYAAGFEYQFESILNLDLQFYYKDIFDEAIRVQQLQTETAQVEAAGRQVSNTGLGRAYGLELLLRREPAKGRRMFGWIAVSLANTDRKSAPQEPWVQSFANQRFNIVGVATWKLPWWELEAGGRMRITDGNPATTRNGSIYDSDADLQIPIPSLERRTLRNDPFFQIDVRIDRRWVFEKWILDCYIEVQNVLNRDNVEGDTPNYDFTLSRPTTGIPIFPYFGVRGEF